ncbi:PPE domain-containing protein [Streptomyces capparidis]
MTLGYRTVRDADLTPLSEAVAKWRNLPGQFDTVAESFRNDVAKGLRDSDWEGKAADAAFRRFDTVEKELKAAADEARDVHRLLDDALRTLRDVQRRLKDVEADIAANEHLRLSAEGQVSYHPPADADGHTAALVKSHQDTVRAYQERIQRVLDDAADADTALHWALTQDGNGRRKGFDPGAFSSLEAAERGRRTAREDARAATELLRLGDGASDRQLARLNKLLSTHEGDPYFAELFATRTGAAGTLDFWRSVADKEHLPDSRRTTLERLQRSLGFTLATATHSESGAMRGWKREMIELGEQRSVSMDTRSNRAVGSYGFQVMSSLMRYGTYETEFLKDYGSKLIAFERDQTGGKGKIGDFWNPTGERSYLNRGGEDWGNDPMAGFMEALGHNPEAAKEFFHSDEKIDPELKYLLEERQWPGDAVSEKGKESGFGYGELGHALEAATLGVPYDQQELGHRRDPATADIARHIISTVTSDMTFVSSRPEISESLARIGAGYLDDLNWAASNFGDASHDQDVRASAFALPGQGERGDEAASHVNLKHETAIAFLEAVGKQEGAYEILSAAQQTYTVNGLKAHLQPDASTACLIETGAKVHGILDQARINDIDETYGAMTEQANRKLAEAAEWKKFGIGTGLGVTAGLATAPFGGPTTSAAVAFAVPAAADTVMGALDTKLGIDIDRKLEQNAANFNQKESMEKREFLEEGRRAAMAPADAYIQALDLPSESPWLQSLDVEGRYNDGQNALDQSDTD